VTGTFRLADGARCRLQHPGLPFVARYHVLALETRGRSARPEEIDGLLVLARRIGRQLATLYFGDGECFTLLYNAGRTRRSGWPHVHIIPARDVAAKRWALLWLWLKHVTRPIARLVGRRSRPSPVEATEAHVAG